MMGQPRQLEPKDVGRVDDPPFVWGISGKSGRESLLTRSLDFAVSEARGHFQAMFEHQRFVG